MPFFIRWMILYLIILPFRPGKIKEKYKKIWDKDGFPLIKHGLRLASKVSKTLGDGYQIELAMRYGSPSIASGLNNLQKSGITELLLFPLFPQYSSATTGSSLEKTLQIIKEWETIPEITLKTSFYDHPGFIQTWANNGKQYWEKNPDHVLFSSTGYLKVI